MFDIIMAVTTNLFRTFITKRFMGIFFVKDVDSKRKEGICYAMFFLLTTSVYLLFHYPPANIVTNIVMIYIIACLYEGERKKKVMITFLIYGINMICDALAIYSFSNYTFGEDYNLVGAYITVLLIALCEFVIERVMVKYNEIHFTPPYWNVILMVPFISIAVILILVVSNLNNRIVLVSTSAGILLINLLIFYLYNAIVDAYRKTEQNAAYEIQISSYANQLDVLRQTEETVNALRHDMKHHLAELYVMSKQNANLDIVRYIEDMQDFISNDVEFVRSGNKEVDSILNYMLNKANNLLDKVECKINIPKEIDLKSFDFTVIFGNLIDNAIEAAQNCSGEKWLFVSLQYEKKMLFINIRNSYKMVNKSGKVYLSTKKDKGHGIGLQNVRKIIASYQGTMEISDEDNVFEVKIVLYL